MKKHFNFKSMYRTALVALCLITVGAGQMWGTDITIYVTGKIFVGEETWDNSTSTIKVDARYKGSEGNFNASDAYMDATMTKTDYTYNGYPIYSYTFTPTNGGGQYRFKHYKGGVWKEDYTAAWSTENGKIYDGYYSSSHHWLTYGRDITIYAVPESMDGSKWDEGYTLKSIFKYGDGDSEKTDKLTWTNTGYTYNGNYIYTCTALMPYNVIKNIKFYYNDGSDKELYDCGPNYGGTQYGTNDIDGKVLLGWNGSSHDWEAYGRDVTVYTIPDYLFKDKGTPYNESSHYPAVCIQMGTGSTWNTKNLTKTAYTYDSYPIYSGTILIDQNKFWEFQIKYFNKVGDSQVDLYQFNQTEPKTEYAPSYIDDKLYHGWNGSSHDFFAYTYDVALDQQSGSGGTSTIKATDGAAMPAAIMPGRDGYAFGGYYTGTGGSGDKYYNDDGSSAANWNSRTITTLYAKWTAREYTITLEDMVPTTAGQGSVTVTFDASTNMTSAVTKPTKTNYTFDGYWTDNDDSGETLVTQLINKDGNWKKDISTYTGHDGSGNPTWIYPNGKSLFAKWIENLHDVTVDVYPSGAGTVQISGSAITKLEDIGYVTHSSEMTAVPANAAWVFKEWQVSNESYLHIDYTGGYTTTGTTMKVTATGDGQTLTAVFEPRYELIGSYWDDDKEGNGGMPGWNRDGTGDFTFNSFTAVDTKNGVNLSYSCSLNANKSYKFRIYDKKDGDYAKNDPSADYYTLQANDTVELSNYGVGLQDVWIHTGGASGLFTFRISKIHEDGGRYYPSVSIDRPQQVNFGQKYLDIDGTLRTGTTGGSATATAGGDALTSGDYVTYNTSVTHTATPEDGYTFAGWWGSDAFEGDRFSNDNPMTYAVTSGDNAYAKFVETSTSVTLSNDGHGKVQIGGADATSTTCGVTTTRELTAVPNEGYMFDSWSKSGDDITLSSTSTNPTTLSGNGSGATSGQTVTANFVERYSIKGTMNGENWGTTHTLSNIGTNAGSKDTCYVTMTLPANTTYEFAIYDEHTKGWYKAGTDAVYDMTYTNHTNWEFGDTKTYNCGITTAGKGTYKFIFNITDKTVTVVYPTSYQVNYGASVGGSVTSVVDGDGNAVPNGGYVVDGGSVTYTAAANDGYTFVGWCGNDTYGDTFTNINPWTNSGVAAASNAYAKFKSTNFVIYRSGDMSSDPRAAYDDVESYAGGTISEAIEFRMKVNRIDKWYTLCLPFTVTAVKVWDEEDGQYYDLVPYYRTGDKYYTGHYIIRTPVSTTDFDIENFDSRDRWVDPSSAAGYLPSANTPYIIQWHDGYFSGKYISFFGSTEESIPTSMNQGANTSSDETVNIYGNNCMTSGTVRDAYMLDPDYGSGGAWLREEVGTDRTVLPFECFIRANATTTAKYRVLRRDMADTPTGWDTVSETENKTTKVLIDNNIYIIREGRIYTIQGTLVKEGK